MGKDLTTGRAAAGTIMSLPPRLVALAGAVGTTQHPGQPVRYDLPTGWTMSDAERDQARNHLSTLTSLLSPDAPFEIEGQLESGQQAKGALLTMMIEGLAGPAEKSKIRADSQVEMYAYAIEELPAWAIEKAIKRWARGSCPKDVEENPRFAFPPSPATLRALAKLEMETPQRQAVMLQNLIASVPLERALDPTPMPGSSPGVPALRRM